MAAIEGDHLGPALTHNAPGPPRVMDVGRRWCDARGVSGRPGASPHFPPPSVLTPDYSVPVQPANATLTPTPLACIFTPPLPLIA